MLNYNNDRFTQKREKKLENGIKWTEGWADFEALNTYHLSDEDSAGWEWRQMADEAWLHIVTEAANDDDNENWTLERAAENQI